VRATTALLVLLLVVPASARPARTPCPTGRFLTPDDAHVVAEVAAPATETIVLDATGIAIEPACARAVYKPHRTRKGTVIRAAWSACGGFDAPVKLRALLPARHCDVLKGVVTIARARPSRRKLRATRAPFEYDVSLDPRSPWPKFRRTSRQDGRSPIVPSQSGGRLWTFRTGKGIFSTPVIDGDGTVYVGSADRTFYAIANDGTLRWSRLTGEIIDSSALLDDRGRVYVGSGDGMLYALDRTTGDVVRTFTADAPAVNAAFINWFEGNVALGGDGSLYVPNDNFFTYALARDDLSVRWRFKTVDQTWSLPAVDVTTGRLFLGNNNLLKALGDNTFAIDAATGQGVWSHGTDGTIAASPLLTRDGRVVVGGFDGFVRAYDAATGAEAWPAPFGARDHVYGSPGELPDGTIVQPSADGSVYGLDPATGAKRWQFDTRDAIRASPAIDGDGNVYVGAGDGRLYVLDPDGTLRWSMQLIDAARDDLNASPALGTDAIVVAGETGEIFSVPYDYCLRAEAASDTRCRKGPGEDLSSDGAALYYTTQFGRQLDVPPTEIEANQPLTFSLFVRAAGDTLLAHIDAASTSVTLDPPVPTRTEVSGDRKFITIVPLAPWAPRVGGALSVTIAGQYLVNPMRDGLRFSGGEVGGNFSQTFTFGVRPVGSDDTLPLPVPSAPGDPAGVWEFYRVAAPLPTILPSYNQIGFDSLHYLIGLVEGGAPGRAIAWVVGGRLADGANTTVVDPATHVLFPLEVTNEGGALTLGGSGFAIEFNLIRLPFEFFRIATRVDAQGNALASPALNVSAVCSGITFYGQFLQQLGFCNPQTDVLTVFGGAELRPHAGGVQQAPGGVGTVAFSASASGVVATLTGTTLRTDAHSLGLLLVDAGTGTPVPLDYAFATARTTDPTGLVQTVTVPFGAVTPPAGVRAYLMVDAYPAASQTLSVP
jgi:outer membrane protein assembly factor BamB